MDIMVFNIPPEVIGDIENLCITKRYINCMKSIMTDLEFVDKQIPD